MMNYTICETATIKDALVAINGITDKGESLLVVNSANQMVGSLTDGDIRRGLISGAQLSDCIKTIMHKNFKFIRQSAFNVKELKEFRELRIKFIPVLDADNKIVDVVNLQNYKSCLPIDAVLMAGGKGERLRPLTEKTPKPLIKVGDKCIIDYNIDRLIEFGVRHINVTVNYLKEQLHEHFSEARNGIKVNTVEEPKFLGTIGSIKFVENFQNDTVLVMNSDLFTNIDFEDFYLYFKETGADMSVAAVPYNVSIPYGILDLDGDNIKGLLEKPTYSYYANAGIYLMKRSVIEQIPENEFYNAPDLMDKLIANGQKVVRYPLNATWVDIGSLSELKRAQEMVNHL